MNASEQEYDWMDPEWYVGQDVREVNEMWEKDKVAGWWTGRRATGGDDRVLQPSSRLQRLQLLQRRSRLQRLQPL